MKSRDEVASLLAEAAVRIHFGADPRLIPAGGIWMGYALPGATAVADVCTVNCNTSSVTLWGGDMDVGAGAALDVARIILTVIRHEPSLRSVVVIKCAEEILRCATDDCAFDAAPYPVGPPGSGTMDWGVESCCRDGVPDIIFMQKNMQNTAAGDMLLWIITETPADGARNIIMLSGCISYTSL